MRKKERYLNRGSPTTICSHDFHTMQNSEDNHRNNFRDVTDQNPNQANPIGFIDPLPDLSNAGSWLV